MAGDLRRLYKVDVVSDTQPVVVVYTVSIYDTELLMDMDLDMELTNEGFLLKYDGDEDDILSPIIPSSLKLSFVVKNEDDKAFIEDLARYQESRFFIDIKRRVDFDGTVEEFWKGVIAQDLIQYEDTRDTFPYTVEINAIDGLTRLKTYEGEMTFTSGNDADVIEWFVELLKKATTELLYLPADAFFAHNINWFDETMPSTADGETPIDPLRYTRLFKENLLYTPGADYDVLVNWYEILQRLCRSYGSRIIHAKGRFNLIQIEGYDVRKAETDKFNLYSYEYETPTLPNMLPEIGVIGYNVVENIRLPYQLDLTTTGNRYNLLPMFANVRIEWESDKPTYLVTPITRDWKIQKCSKYVVPVNGVVAYTYDFTTGGTGAWKLDIYYYIEITDIVAPNTKYYLDQNFTWSTNPLSVYKVTRTGFAVGSQVFVTTMGNWPLMPADCTVCVRIATQVQYGMNQVPVDTTFTSTVKGSQNSIVYINDLPLYDNSSLQYVISNPIYKDILDLAIVPDHNIRTFGGYWGKFIAWVRDTPSNTNGVPYPEFIGQAIVNLFNDVSRKRYYGDVWDSWIPMQSIPYDGGIYVVNRAELKPATGYWDVTMLEVRDAVASQGTRPWEPGRRFGKQGKQASDVLGEVGDTRVSYQGEFVDGNSYLKNDLVLKGGVLAVAKRNTISEPIEDEYSELYVSPSSLALSGSSTSASTVKTGNKYIMADSGVLDNFSVYVPVASDGVKRYTIVIKNTTTGEQYGISDFIVPANTWSVELNYSIEVVIGDIIEALLFSTNSNDEDVFTFDYELNELGTSAAPAEGKWNTSVYNNKLRINIVDKDSVDISSTLSSVSAGSTITFQDSSNLSSYYTFFIMADGVLVGDVYEYDVLLSGAGEDMTTGTVSVCAVSIPIESTVSYKYNSDHWISNQPSFAEVEGIINSSYNNNSYGISVRFKKQSVNLDWSVLAGSEKNKYNNFPHLPSGTHVVNKDWGNRVILVTSSVDYNFTAGDIGVGFSFEIFVKVPDCVFMFAESFTPPYPNTTDFQITDEGGWAEIIWTGSIWIIKQQ